MFLILNDSMITQFFAILFGDICKELHFQVSFEKHHEKIITFI